MAFLKTARGALVHRNFSPQNWANFLGENQAKLIQGNQRVASGSVNLVTQASEILKEDFDSSKYLLSHVTIVASVDTEEVPNVKLGNVSEQGQQINRKWSNYHITPQTEGWINSNQDCWDRPVLLKSYRTFVGAHSFLEHVQVEDLSKGRIIDAVARDIGSSVYVDILVANHRKHADLIQAIESGALTTLSMGCTVSDCQCSKCGNVAADETQMCPCIKYAKGNTFFDVRGIQRKVAEICGHFSLEPTGGVNFIEASWVATPAFTGAVMRNILEPATLNVDTQSTMREMLASPPPKWTQPDGVQTKAAKLGFDFGEDTETPAESPPADSGGAAPPSNGLDELESELEKFVLENVKKKLKDKLKTQVQEEAASSPKELGTSTGEGIIHQASVNKRAQAYVTGIAALVRVARSEVELLDNLARLNEGLGIKVPRDVYLTTLRVGSTRNYDTLGSYLGACAKILGHQPTAGEAKTLVRLGQILSLSSPSKTRDSLKPSKAQK